MKVTRSEIEDAIRETEEGPKNYQTCQKLATYYALLDHMEPRQMYYEAREPKIEYEIGNYGNSDFLRMVAGCDPSYVWPIMDELLSTIQVLNPRLYDSVMRKLS